MKLVINKEMVTNMLSDGEQPQAYIQQLFKYILNDDIVFHQNIHNKCKYIKVEHKGKLMYSDTKPELCPMRLIVLEVTKVIQQHLRDAKIKEII